MRARFYMKLSKEYTMPDRLSVGTTGQDGEITIYNGDGKLSIHLRSSDALLRIGGEDKAGLISVRDNSSGAGKETIRLNGARGDVILGGHGTDGDLTLRDNATRNVIHFSANEGVARIGGGSKSGQPGPSGEIWIRDGNGETPIHLRASDALFRIGGEDKAGVISVRDNSSGAGKETIRLSGAQGDVILGGHGTDGDLTLRDNATRNVIHFSANEGVARIGGGSKSGEAGPDGEIWLRDGNGETSIHLRARDSLMRVGGGGTAGLLSVRDDSSGAGKEMIRIDGSTGDIVFKNADLAEEFDVATDIEPGTVAVLDQDGTLVISSTAYDKRVVGVVSGAGSYDPGLILDKQEDKTDRMPIALVGKVYCKVDATDAPIEVGDLLTTSHTPGHAMRACDPMQAFGTVIGKALSPLHEGTGMIPIVVALQ